eukprot:GDKJ01013455.1.p1 GENE.GDKJ01013455.1~~GDKJ01013455.1.p1  ORF type:complete len:653 (+),score=127.69 GDKJ01013455.1:83-1960(+)
MDPPSEEDLAQTEIIRNFLIDRGLFENEEQLTHRQRVLSKLDNVVKEWVHEVGLALGMSDAEARRGGGKIFTFGSYKLGIAQPNSDIDALCCVPRHVTRESFFTSLHLKLSEMQGVTELKRVQEAFTPLMNFILDGIEIDLLFASLNVDTVGKNLPDLTNDNLLRSLDAQTVRSLNGSRVADSILQLIPDYSTFTLTLRFVKEWAGARGIYSNVLGFFGGITWALLVARVCQMYPKASPAQQIENFFSVYSTYQFGRSNPVMLCPLNKTKLTEPGFTNLSIWDPVSHPHDRLHLIPILTPAFPSMNSTHNVSQTTFQILISELQRGHALLSTFKKNQNLSLAWSRLLQPLKFFDVFPNYLQIQILATDLPRLHLWSGFLEANLRHLLKSFESVTNLRVRPFPKFLTLDLTKEEDLERIPAVSRPKDADNDKNKKTQVAVFYFGITKLKSSTPHAPPTVTNSIDLRPQAQAFLETVLLRAPSAASEAYRRGLINIKISHVTRSQLPSCLKSIASDTQKAARADVEKMEEEAEIARESERVDMDTLGKEEGALTSEDLKLRESIAAATLLARFVPVTHKKEVYEHSDNMGVVEQLQKYDLHDLGVAFDGSAKRQRIVDNGQRIKFVM